MDKPTDTSLHTARTKKKNPPWDINHLQLQGKRPPLLPSCLNTESENLLTAAGLTICNPDHTLTTPPAQKCWPILSAMNPGFMPSSSFAHPAKLRLRPSLSKMSPLCNKMSLCWSRENILVLVISANTWAHTDTHTHTHTKACVFGALWSGWYGWVGCSCCLVTVTDAGHVHGGGVWMVQTGARLLR